MKSPIYKVSRHAGMNPVARAVAKTRLRAAITDYRISIFLNDEGEDCAGDVATIWAMVDVVMQTMADKGCTDYRKLKSADSVLNQCADSGFKWRKDYAVTLDNALAIVLDVYPNIPPQEANRAIHKVINPEPS